MNKKKTGKVLFFAYFFVSLQTKRKAICYDTISDYTERAEKAPVALRAVAARREGGTCVFIRKQRGVFQENEHLRDASHRKAEVDILGIER